MERAFKVICCYCGHIHIHHDIDDPREHCEVCKRVLSFDSSWDSHSVRIYVEDADPKLIENFIAEIKVKKFRVTEKDKPLKKKVVSRITSKVA